MALQQCTSTMEEVQSIKRYIDYTDSALEA